MDIVLATSNPHKVEELSAIFASAGLSGVRLLTLARASPAPIAEPAETGTTFEANATIKARAYARALSRWCLADDSGLEIDALEGRPGVISSHYSSDGAELGLSRPQRDEQNNARVLRELQGVPAERRTARFRCVMVLADASGQVRAVASGAMEGRIGEPGPDRVPRGANGFGYDPLFLTEPDFARTGAELSPAEKHAISHRGRAGRAMAEKIRTL
jgi:XTP/dITP diphosphohydrolase